MTHRHKINDIMLIEQVKKHRVLYDPECPQYLDSKAKDSIWDLIGQELNCDGARCKSRWNNMRDQYRRRFINPKSRNGEKLIYYKYTEQMEFIKPFLKKIRNTNNNINQFNFVEVLTVSSPEQETIDNEEDLDITEHSIGYHENKPEEEMVKKVGKVEEPDELDVFLTAMALTLKKLSKLQQHSAKAEIFALVQKYEMEMLACQIKTELD